MSKEKHRHQLSIILWLGHRVQGVEGKIGKLVGIIRQSLLGAKGRSLPRFPLLWLLAFALCIEVCTGSG